MNKHKQHGFSLIELMVVLAIVGILVKIAYPSYQESVLKSKRADAKASLSQLANWMERYYTANGCYTGTPTNGVCPTGGADIPTPLPFITSPQSGTFNYDLTVTTNTTAAATTTALGVTVPAGGFTLTATPRTNTADPCGSLTLDNTGSKNRTGTNTVTYTPNYCWTGTQ